MKLYTEEQVRKAIHIKSNNIDLLTSDNIIDSLTPIELPSDEEIKHISELNLVEPYASYWRTGIKWLKLQIKQQDNGTI